MDTSDENSGCASVAPIQVRVKLEPATSELVELAGSQFWDRSILRPVADGRFGDPESACYRSAGLEMGDDIFLEHATMLGITYRVVKDDFQDEGYSVPTMETMGDRIRMLRQAKGLTQEELGRRVGVHKVSVSQWETGSTANIKLPIVLSLIQELGTSLEYLVYGPDQKNTQKGRRQG